MIVQTRLEPHLNGTSIFVFSNPKPFGRPEPFVDQKFFGRDKNSVESKKPGS